ANTMMYAALISAKATKPARRSVCVSFLVTPVALALVFMVSLSSASLGVCKLRHRHRSYSQMVRLLTPTLTPPLLPGYGVGGVAWCHLTEAHFANKNKDKNRENRLGHSNAWRVGASRQLRFAGYAVPADCSLPIRFSKRSRAMTRSLRG